MVASLTPNCHSDSIHDVDPSQIAAIVFGPQRSGSSWTWQVIGRFLSQGLIRTHSLLDLPESVPVVCTYRDPREIVVSSWRVYEPGRGARLTMDQQDIYTIVANRQRDFWVLAEYRRRPGVLLIRYEELLASPLSSFKLIVNHMDLRPSDAQLSMALDEHSAERNRQLAMNGPVPERLMLKQHVHEAQASVWRRFVPEEHRKLLTELLRPQLNAWGYREEG